MEPAPRLAPICILLGALLAAPAWAAPTTMEELEACLRANEPKESSVQTVLFRSRDRADQTLESRAKVFWKRFDGDLSRVMLRITDPPSQRDSAVLLIEKDGSDQPDFFMYLPELGRSRRVTSRMVTGSLFGTDFSYEDFQRLQGYARDRVASLETGHELNGRPVVRVEGKPASDSGSAYERTVTFYDQETCLPLESRFFERGDEPRKVLRADPEKLTERDGRHFPLQFEMRDARDGTTTLVVIEALEVDVPIKRKMFSERELEAGAR